jgi:molybdopterin-guanine dinucleotide biosynthesis protein A
VEITGAILAGGRSLRMGRDKSTMIFKGKPLITYVYEILREIFPKIVVISSHHTTIEGIEAPILRDFVPKKASIIGIASALLSATTDYVFVVGCDMPFIREETITYMVDQAHGEDIVIPQTDAGYEPLHALYNRSCLPHMLRAIDFDRIKITDLFPFLSVKVVREEALFKNNGISTFTNINTEEDLALAKSLIG